MNVLLAPTIDDDDDEVCRTCGRGFADGLVAIEKLRRDVLQSSRLLDISEVRFLVEAYYSLQDYRMQAKNQERASSVSGEPHEVITWQFQQMHGMETTIKRVLTDYTDREPTGMGQWAKSVIGIGPVLAAGLLAHVDISKCTSAGDLWAFAGLDPTRAWSKGQKRPWNARLKVLCWKAGESFVKVSGKPESLYGQLYVERKQREIQRNEAGLFAEQAAAVLASKKIGKDTDAYKAYSQGKLPPAHIHARAKRYAVKIFLAHFFEESYRRYHHVTQPPLPYPIQHMGHVHQIAPEV